MPRHARAARGASIVWLVLACGCSKPAPSSSSVPPPEPTAAPASAAGNRVVGKGPLPNSGSAVVVVLEPRTARTFAPQTEEPVMDQVNLSFTPELLLVRTGQPVEFRNDDDTLHNVHVSHEETRTPAFNVAIPTDGAYTYTFERDGFYRVGCDIHPSMAAAVFAAASPYTTLAESDGSFSFIDVAPGQWRVVIYASGRRLQQDVEVKNGVTTVTVE